MAQITNFGLSKYAMRIWLDPARLTNLGLTAMDVENGIQEQNQQAATGTIGQAPAPAGQAFQYQLNTLGRLDQVSQFEDIIVRANPDGSVVRIRDVARVELGAEEYDWDTKLNGKPTATVIVFQLAGANGLQIKTDVSDTMSRLAKNFPEDMQWTIRYDTTLFITESIKEVIVTLLEAVALVESQIGKQVFVVNKDNKVESRSVEVGRGYQGQWVIKKGLKKGERVIVEGTQKVRPGMVVNSKPYASKKEVKAG